MLYRYQALLPEYLHEVLLVGSHLEALSLSLTPALSPTSGQLAVCLTETHREIRKKAEEHSLKNDRSLSLLQAQSVSHTLCWCSIRP